MAGGSVRSYPSTWHILHEDNTDNRSNNRRRHRENPDMQRRCDENLSWTYLVAIDAYG